MTAPKSDLQSRAAIELHVAVALFGAAGLFGKLVSGSPELIAFARTLVAALVLLVFLRLSSKRLPALSPQSLLLITLSGLLLAAHWVSFFYAIQVSTVAVALVGFAAFPIVVALLEPLLFGLKLKPVDVASGVVVGIGLMVVAPEFTLSDTTTRGLIWGIASGLLFALLILSNRQTTRTVDSQAIALLQYAIASVLLLPLFLINDGSLPEPGDLLLLVVLGVVFTALPHTLFIRSLAKVKASHASVVVGLEPIYGIALATLLLNEIPAKKTLFGAALILGAVMVSTRSHREKP